MTIRRALRSLLFWAFGLGLGLACVSGQALAQAPAQTLELRAAQATVTLKGQTQQQAVNLPYHWDRKHPGLAGSATFELAFELAAVPIEPYALYLPRLGNAYEIWLNGTLLQTKGDLQQGNGADYAKAPRLIELDPSLLRTRNVFRVHIRADVGRRGGLAPLTLGPRAQVQELYQHDYDWRITGSLAVVIFSLLIGVVALALWATQVDVSASGWLKRDPLYLFAALAELSWTLRIGDTLIAHSPIAWPWWGMVGLLAATVWVSSMMLFCVEVADWGRLTAAIWLRRWLGLLLATSVAAGAAALAGGFPLAMTLLYAALGLTALIFASLFIWQAARGASLAHRLVALVLLWNTLVGLRDLYVFRISQGYGGNTLMRYSSVLFGVTLGCIVIMRFRAASAQARDLNANLLARVAHREQELTQSYQRLEQLAREQERALERSRILRDMHDGVGSHISTAIRQLESGRSGPGEVLQTLRDSLDQLKLSIDAMNLPPGDINALLANIRYRLEPRFLACNIAWQWNVEVLKPVSRLDASAMRQLQFMLFEALSNVLQHAQASVLQIAASSLSAAGTGVRLQIIDNGRGFDVAQVKHRGLLSMQERAHAIDATLDISSTARRTRLEITIE
ncbi:MAG: histidine kinase [Gammaproteobacteria bacterium]|uniref:sensor histidine kinase n=1 Tax=Rhodoferax sp. TaxID=50421 RepID=UPI0017ECFB23|nr:histidine kinase [Rhodoferax sp.]MBU3897995.1 histidine kinase [Gammaproteobacteria bacterium]MBA3057833.1 histidine kinase [Rhodoferax sp.]MBU3995944.1 histidine kinase [Gammaproteobacteria bacterium]MBU4078996.1 histidine kinase [Gammaproteobacteria bacterium]MBU4112486.1 histidine kinase [Gammaproteobacteria bacterium]